MLTRKEVIEEKLLFYKGFPCFDEPVLKTPFDISIGRSSKFHSLSNSNLISTRPLKGSPGWFIDSFNTTVNMSTYLVALVVSDFTFSEADSSIFNGKPVRVYGPKYLMDQGAGEFGAKVSAQALAFYEKYFELEYPLPKMDSVAVPGFLYGAMENYGLNIYREFLLLNIPGVATQQQMSRSSSVIAHELAHQYWGNIVTCRWWSNIWLNEGFATYYSYLGQNATNPEFEPIKQFLLDGPQYAFALDSREKTSYPLLLTAKTQSQFEDQAIGLPYYKGASLIRMMHGFLTPDTFHKGINRYLKAWANKATEQDNLFDALTDQGHEDGTLPLNLTVKEIMDPWTKQRGYPLIRVVSSDEDTVYINYEQFKSSSVVRKTQHTSWPIPISYATQDDPNFNDHVPKFWIPEGSMMRTIKYNTSKWIFVNPETTGFYRVVYDKKLTQLLHNQFSKDYKVISPMSRSQILDDYFSLATQMDIPISMALDFTKHLGHETEDICWSVFLKHLRRLHYFYSEYELKLDSGYKNVPKKYFEGFRNYMIPKLEEVLSKIGLEQLPNETGSKIIFRARLLNWACRLGSQKCLDYATRLFELWKFNEPIPIDLRDSMYCYGVSAGGVKNWLFALQRSVNETNTKEALLLVSSLGCITDERILKSLLQSTLEGDSIDKFRMSVIIDAVADNPLGRPVLMKFLKDSIPSIQKQFNSSFNAIVYRAFMKLGNHLHTEEELLELQSIIELHSSTIGEILPALSSFATDVSENVVWMSKHYEPMKTWFDKQTKSSIPTI